MRAERRQRRLAVQQGLQGDSRGVVVAELDLRVDQGSERGRVAGKRRDGAQREVLGGRELVQRELQVRPADERVRVVQCERVGAVERVLGQGVLRRVAGDRRPPGRRHAQRLQRGHVLGPLRDDGLRLADRARERRDQVDRRIGVRGGLRADEAAHGQAEDDGEQQHAHRRDPRGGAGPCAPVRAWPTCSVRRALRSSCVACLSRWEGCPGNSAVSAAPGAPLVC